VGPHTKNVSNITGPTWKTTATEAFTELNDAFAPRKLVSVGYSPQIASLSLNFTIEKSLHNTSTRATFWI
jgi:hypothetical protein